MSGQRANRVCCRFAPRRDAREVPGNDDGDPPSWKVAAPYSTLLYSLYAAPRHGPNSYTRAMATVCGRLGDQGPFPVVTKVAELPIAEADPTIIPVPLVVIEPVERTLPASVWLTAPESEASPHWEQT